MSRHYIFLDASDIPSINFEEVLESSEETLRFNLAKDKTFVKYEGATPSFLIGKPKLTYSEIRKALSDPEWFGTNEEE